MITVRKKEDGSYEVVNGHLRLRVGLEYRERVMVQDITSGTAFYVAYAPYDLTQPIEGQQRSIVKVA